MVSRDGNAAFLWQGGDNSSSPEVSWKPGSLKFFRAFSQMFRARLSWSHAFHSRTLMGRLVGAPMSAFFVI